MVLARLASRVGPNKHKLGCDFVRRFCSKEIVTSDDKNGVIGQSGSYKNGNESKKLDSDTRKQSKRYLIWKMINLRDDFVPALYEYFPSGLGDSLIQATNNFNTLFEKKPSLKNRPVRELDDCYKIRYLGFRNKENVQITVEDGILRVIKKGKGKEEDVEGPDDERWGWSFGCYETSFVLPKDAKADEIDSEIKDGALNIVIPRTEKRSITTKDVKELPPSS